MAGKRGPEKGREKTRWLAVVPSSKAPLVGEAKIAAPVEVLLLPENRERGTENLPRGNNHGRLRTLPYSHAAAILPLPQPGVGHHAQASGTEAAPAQPP